MKNLKIILKKKQSQRIAETANLFPFQQLLLIFNWLAE